MRSFTIFIQSQEAAKQTLNLPVIWVAMTLVGRNYNDGFQV